MLTDSDVRACVRLGAFVGLLPKQAGATEEVGNVLKALVGSPLALAIGGGLLSGYGLHKLDAGTSPEHVPSEEQRLRTIRMFREAGGHAEAELARASQ